VKAWIIESKVLEQIENVKSRFNAIVETCSRLTGTAYNLYIHIHDKDGKDVYCHANKSRGCTEEEGICDWYYTRGHATPAIKESQPGLFNEAQLNNLLFQIAKKFELLIGAIKRYDVDRIDFRNEDPEKIEQIKADIIKEDLDCRAELQNIRDCCDRLYQKTTSFYSISGKLHVRKTVSKKGVITAPVPTIPKPVVPKPVPTVTKPVVHTVQLKPVVKGVSFSDAVKKTVVQVSEEETVIVEDIPADPTEPSSATSSAPSSAPSSTPSSPYDGKKKKKRSSTTKNTLSNTNAAPVDVAVAAPVDVAVAPVVAPVVAVQVVAPVAVQVVAQVVPIATSAAVAPKPKTGLIKKCTIDDNGELVLKQAITPFATLQEKLQNNELTQINVCTSSGGKPNIVTAYMLTEQFVNKLSETEIKIVTIGKIVDGELKLTAVQINKDNLEALLAGGMKYEEYENDHVLISKEDFESLENF
jgi:hypothetical protein